MIPTFLEHMKVYGYGSLVLNLARLPTELESDNIDE